MSLSSEVIARFVKATNGEDTNRPDTTVYGTIVNYEGRKFVRIDGSDLLTPVSSTASADENERVSVSIKNHSAVVTGNLSSPAARTDDVTDIGNQITEFEIVVADKVSVKEFDAQSARIDELVAYDLTVKNKLTATDAEIENLIAKDAEITGTLIANKAEIDELLAKKIDAELVKANYAEIGELEALRIDVRDLDAVFGDFQELTASNFEAVNGTIENLDSTYANIDFANIGEAAIRKIFSDTGLIKDLITENGTVTGELVGVTIKGDLIEAGTLKADRLVVLGTDGNYYKLNLDGMDLDTEVVPEDQIHGKSIVAQSITADKLTVSDLVAFNATIGGFKIDNNAIRSLVKDGPLNTTRGTYMDNDGQFAVGATDQFVRFYEIQEGIYRLEILADSITIGGRTKTLVEELDELGNSTGETKIKVTSAEQKIDSILGQISTLVTDNNGESLMTQTPTGWTFKTTSIENSVNSLSTSLNDLSTTMGSTSSTVNALSHAVSDLQNTANYVRIRDYESEPCIELGETESDFKLLITNTRIMFLDGAGAIPTYIDRTGIITDNITVKSTIRQGNFGWILRANGHLTLQWSDTEPVYFGVTNAFNNVTGSNSLTAAQLNNSYTTKLTPYAGYEINSVIVTMNEIDITGSAWNPNTGVVKVEFVTGKISISATASVVMYTVSRNMTNVWSSSTVNSVAYGSYYSDTLTFVSGYVHAYVTVLIGGVDKTTEVYNPANGSIYIAEVLGDIVINASAISSDTMFTITNNLSNVTNTNTNNSTRAGSSYSASLVLPNNYRINSVIVTMGGNDVTHLYYNSDNRSIIIDKVIGDIVITATASVLTWIVTNDLTNVMSSNEVVSIVSGSTYETTLTATNGYGIEQVSVVVKMGGVDITTNNGVFDTTTNKIKITNVTGDISITAVAYPVYTVTHNLTNATSTGLNITNVLAGPGSSWTSIITPTEGYKVDLVTVTVGGVDVTSTAYNSDTGVITVTNINGDIVVTVVTSVMMYKIEISRFEPSYGELQIYDSTNKKYYYSASNGTVVELPINTKVTGIIVASGLVGCGWKVYMNDTIVGSGNTMYGAGPGETAGLFGVVTLTGDLEIVFD